MDVYEYLKQLPLRADYKLSRYKEEIGVLYLGNASSPAIRRYLIEKYDVTVSRQAIWEFCKRHFSKDESAGIRVERSNVTGDVRPSLVPNAAGQNSLNTQPPQTSQQQSNVTEPTDLRSHQFQRSRPEPASTDYQVRPLHEIPSAPFLPPSNLPSAGWQADTSEYVARSNAPAAPNASQIPPSFSPETDAVHGNIDWSEASRSREPEPQDDIALFGPAENLRKPHDLGTPAAKDRLSRFRKLRAEGKI
jgi:hypothetical protein